TTLIGELLSGILIHPPPSLSPSLGQTPHHVGASHLKTLTFAYNLRSSLQLGSLKQMEHRGRKYIDRLSMP
ncbi:MAG: hypothetical protein ABL965_10515, partial [Nitrospira sp.]